MLSFPCYYWAVWGECTFWFNNKVLYIFQVFLILDLIKTLNQSCDSFSKLTNNIVARNAKSISGGKTTCNDTTQSFIDRRNHLYAQCVIKHSPQKLTWRAIQSNIWRGAYLHEVLMTQWWLDEYTNVLT